MANIHKTTGAGSNSHDPREKKIVNEQEQLEPVNPSDLEDEQTEKTSHQENTSRNEEKPADLEKGNTYEEDPKKSEGKMPR